MFTRQKEEGWREAGEEELGGGKSCPEEGSVGVSKTLSAYYASVDRDSSRIPG